MLAVCRKDLTPEDFDRLETHTEAIVQPVRWTRRGGRLILQVDPTETPPESWEAFASDPAIEYLLSNPSEGEITRLFSRRDILDLALASTGALACAAFGGPLALFFSTPPGERAPRGDVFVGRADAFKPNSARTKLIDDEEFLVIRRDETRFFALAATCTHSEICLLRWDPDRGQIVCPCHQGAFDVQGNVVSGPPPRPLQRREVRLRDGAIYVRRST